MMQNIQRNLLTKYLAVALIAALLFGSFNMGVVFAYDYDHDYADSSFVSDNNDESNHDDHNDNDHDHADAENSDQETGYDENAILDDDYYDHDHELYEPEEEKFAPAMELMSVMPLSAGDLTIHVSISLNNLQWGVVPMTIPIDHALLTMVQQNGGVNFSGGISWVLNSARSHAHIDNGSPLGNYFDIDWNTRMLLIDEAALTAYLADTPGAFDFAAPVINIHVDFMYPGTTPANSLTINVYQTINGELVDNAPFDVIMWRVLYMPFHGLAHEMLVSHGEVGLPFPKGTISGHTFNAAGSHAYFGAQLPLGSYLDIDWNSGRLLVDFDEIHDNIMGRRSTLLGAVNIYVDFVPNLRPPSHQPELLTEHRITVMHYTYGWDQTPEDAVRHGAIDIFTIEQGNQFTANLRTIAEHSFDATHSDARTTIVSGDTTIRLYYQQYTYELSIIPEISLNVNDQHPMPQNNAPTWEDFAMLLEAQTLHRDDDDQIVDVTPILTSANWPEVDFDTLSVTPHAVEVTATWPGGQTDTQTVLVHIVDTKAPVIMVANNRLYFNSDNIPRNIEAILAMAGVTAIDNFDGSVAVQASFLGRTSFANIDWSEAGEHALILRASDSSGNHAGQRAIAVVVTAKNEIIIRNNNEIANIITTAVSVTTGEDRSDSMMHSHIVGTIGSNGNSIGSRLGDRIVITASNVPLGELSISNDTMNTTMIDHPNILLSADSQTRNFPFIWVMWIAWAIAGLLFLIKKRLQKKHNEEVVRRMLENSNL